MYSISKNNFFLDPYPHMVVDDFFLEPQTIIENFESQSYIKEFKEQFTSITKQLLTDLRFYFKNLDNLLIPEIIFRNHSSHAGIRLIRGSHLDSGKTFNSVFYLEEVFDEKNPPHAGSFQIMEDLDDSKDPIKQIDYKFNRALFFQNTDNSYHRFWSRYPSRMSIGISYTKEV